MTPLVIHFLKANDFFYGEYAEPFAGGSGIAMSLLLNDFVSRVYLNDIDPAIHAFWSSVTRHADDLCELVEVTPVSLEEREKQRQVFLGQRTGSIVERGFATLFLNRTNRSGILKGGVIGGKEQKGEYKLDCRFNRVDLVRKIQRIAANRQKISLTRLDAQGFLRTVVPKMHEKTLINLDPPYFQKGPELYTNFYKADDHAALAKEVAALRRRWIVTYDDAPEIRKLYRAFPMFCTSLNYFAQDKRVGSELLVTDPKLQIPDLLRAQRIAGT